MFSCTGTSSGSRYQLIFLFLLLSPALEKFFLFLDNFLASITSSKRIIFLRNEGHSFPGAAQFFHFPSHYFHVLVYFFLQKFAPKMQPAGKGELIDLEISAECHLFLREFVGFVAFVSNVARHNGRILQRYTLTHHSLLCNTSTLKYCYGKIEEDNQETNNK